MHLIYRHEQQSRMAYMLANSTEIYYCLPLLDGFGWQIICTLPMYHDTSRCQIAIEAGEKCNVPYRICVKCPVAHILHQRCSLHLSPFLGPSKDRLKYPQPKGSSAFSKVEPVKSPNFLTYLICLPRPQRDPTDLFDNLHKALLTKVISIAE